MTNKDKPSLKTPNYIGHTVESDSAIKTMTTETLFAVSAYKPM